LPALPNEQSLLTGKPEVQGRLVYRGVHQDEVDAVRRRQSTAAFRQRLVERKWKIEGLFGEAKQNHGLRRARYRGLPKVQIQFFMIAIALNCKRVVTMTYRSRLILHFLRQLLLRTRCSPGELNHQPTSQLATA
jgi:hypothetical protein